MTLVFRASLISFAFALIFADSARAQTPTPLTPEPSKNMGGASRDTTTQLPKSTPLGSPMRLAPIRPNPLAAENHRNTNQSAPSGYRRNAIHTEGLAEIDPNTVGILNEKNGGFGLDMWQGTPRSLIEKLLPKIPSAIRSVVLRNLGKRLLLSAAAMPAWQNPGSNQSKNTLIFTRISILQSMGAFKEARQLAAITPKKSRNPGVKRLQADDRLFANDLGGACQIVSTARENLTQAYWQKLLIFCQTLQGNPDGAALGTSLLVETLGGRDAPFFQLMDQINQITKAPLALLPEPNALLLAAMRVAKITIPDDSANSQNPAILRAIGVSPNAQLNTRLAAAEAAAGFGALHIERLAEIYLAEKFSPPELDNALSLSAADRSPRGRALLFHTSKIETGDMAQAAIFTKALEIAGEEGNFLPTIRLYLPLLTTVRPSSQLNWFAPTAARALYSVDRPLPAQNWAEVLRPEAVKSEKFQKIIDRLWFLTLLTDQEEAQQEFDLALSRWITSHHQTTEKESTLKIVAGLNLLSALGYAVPDSAWWRVLNMNEVPKRSSMPFSYRTAIERAAVAGRRGETILLSILALASLGPKLESFETVATVVKSLRTIGLEREARKLALELAATAGL